MNLLLAPGDDALLPGGDTIDLEGWTAVGASVDARWAARYLVGDSVDARWLIRLISSMALNARWATRSSVGDTSDIRWNIRVFVGGEVDARWDARSLAGDALALAWPLRGLSGAQAALGWAVRSVAQDSLSAPWEVRERHATVPDDLALAWAVGASVGRGLFVQYQVARNISHVTHYKEVTGTVVRRRFSNVIVG